MSLHSVVVCSPCTCTYLCHVSDWTPLHEAANHGRVDIVSFLLEHEADIHAQGHDKTTPLLDAVYGGHYEVCCVCHTGFPMAAIFECVGLYILLEYRLFNTYCTFGTGI